MNKKFYVPFQTAKLLKKAGYPQVDCDMYFDPNGKLRHSNEIVGAYPIVFEKCFVAAPAYCEVIDWLMCKNIAVITIEMFEIRWTQCLLTDERIQDMEWFCNIYIDNDIARTDEYPTREQAINAAIIKALEE